LKKQLNDLTLSAQARQKETEDKAAEEIHRMEMSFESRLEKIQQTTLLESLKSPTNASLASLKIEVNQYVNPMFLISMLLFFFYVQIISSFD